MVTVEKVEDIAAKAAEELRSVARFMDAHAEAIVGEMDECYVPEDGISVSFALLERDSIPTIRVSKEFFVMEKKR